MIPRYQRILFWILVVGIALMAAFLLHGCRQAHKRLTAFNDSTPIAAPTPASAEDITLYLASDADGSITPTTSHVALPQDPGLRARTLLDHLLAQYALPNSAHPLQPGPAVDDVFLLNNQAVINLRGSFIDNHPSGVLVETLTLQSIIGTLHAALPQITEIRFLVDGEPHDTLAGHADLQRTYPAADTSFKPTAPSEEATQQ
jgi:hypothetical protein